MFKLRSVWVFLIFQYSVLFLISVRTVSAQEQLSRPEDIKLTGNKRVVDLSSPTGNGRLKLRWQREVEQLFKKSPERAVIEALQTTARVLKTAGFPPELQNLDLDWNIVFIASELNSNEVPAFLISNCHPGWMRPPADIYIVAERVVQGCAGSSKPSADIADAYLAELILHEIGHVVEFNFHKGHFPNDKFRAEGFATWFSAQAANNSSLISAGKVLQEQRRLAVISLQQQPTIFTFLGTAPDYARAAMYFHALVEKKRVHGLMRVYSTMLEKRVDFFAGVRAVFNWDEKQFNNEMLKFVR